MSILLNINGTDYAYPETNDVSWGPDATDWAVAVTNGMLQKEGGLFILLADVDFGSSFGLISQYYTSRTANAASAGQFRLANTDVVSWRNGANSSNLNLGVSGDALTFNGVAVGNFVSVSDTSTIDLTLSAGVLSADIPSLSITNSLISASAAIAVSKLAALTASRAVVSDGSGFLSVATTTATEIGYVNGVTSAIQTQIDGKEPSFTLLPLSKGGTNANLTAANGAIPYSTATAFALLAPGSAGQVLTSGGAGAPTWSAGLTNPMTTGGDIIYGGGSGTPTRLANGTDGQYLKSSGGTSAPTWATFTAPTIQQFTSGSGTYTTPAGVKYIKVKLVGGGGGGAGSGGSGVTSGGTGGTTTFGTTLLSASGGAGGSTSGAGGVGGAASLGTGPIGLAQTGGSGGDGDFIGAGAVNSFGGGNSPYFAGGGRPVNAAGGMLGTTNSGGGGSGGGGASSVASGASGGSGGFVDAIIGSPAATYAYAVGAAGTAGSAGTSGFAGGAGAAGQIIVEEYYQ